ncbi:Oidioi.mRNA.OKI2018_I69.chr1.g3845.t1.cds [Oikopleura dioica]|uniref:Oidioi.mRNA.OKI2018_I69.chr1.g3845.t1.cds n=1 Tax=Oikopleura dioica TaxID=34765 RepID=A0ABN7SYY2_OIKDI|nr:Oidioi.mRNA.OKI2018_I69.chr1.g3845.t1.cds [Oikopleura dioica]
MASALSEVGIPDAERLKTLFNSTNDPMKLIINFEEQNRISLGSLVPALNLLDLHEVTRNEFYQSVFDQLKLVFERRIEDFSKKTQEDRNEALLKILDKAFPLAGDPLLQPFVMRMLSKLESIPQDKLEKIMSDPVLYQNAPTDVRRHIWLSKPDLFREEVQGLVRQFVEETELQVMNFTTDCPVLKNPREKRAKCAVLQQIVGMTSGNKDLYENAVIAIKSEFTKTPLHAQPFVASLRSGLLMALHDSKFKDILQRDEIYKFTWCMDACIRANSIDEKQRRELTTVLNGIKKSGAIIDAALIVFDPSCINLILVELEKELRQILKVQGFPKGSEKIDFLIRMLKLGTSAPEMAEELSKKLSFSHSFLNLQKTSIVNQMALEEERTLDALIRKVSEEPKKEQNDLDENQNYSISTDVWVEQMGIHGRFAGQLFRVLLRACENFQVILPLLGRHCRDMLSDQIFLFEIAQHLIKTKKNMNEDLFQKIFLKFFVSGKQPREIAAKFAEKIIETLGEVITPEFKSQYEEKLKKSKEKEKKDKDKKKKKDKKEDADDAVPRDKSGKVSKKKGKKGKIDKTSDPLKLTLKNLA